MIDQITFLFYTIALLLFLFWIWSFYDMINSKKLKKTEKGLWSIGYLFLSIPTAIIWLIVRK